MNQPAPGRRFVGVSRVSAGGALYRLGPEGLSLVWVNPSRSVWMVGLGFAARGEGVVECEVEPPAGPWFGGWPFAGSSHSRWMLPEVLAWWNGRATTFLAFGPEGTPRSELEARLDRVEEQEPVTTRMPVRRLNDARAPYEQLVDRAVKALGSELSKLVVARTIELEADRDFSERSILKGLEARNQTAWTFLLRQPDGSAFLGASPELLADANGRVFRTDALAGTAAACEGEQLLRSDKDRREHQAVVDDLRARLDPFVTSLELPAQPVLKPVGAIVHLHTPITATLREGVSALEVASALHPTPAVAGAPRSRAIEWLAANEGLERGWYCGAIGARGAGSLTLAVGLRSATIRANRASVYVGAGIVKGSTPEGEWLETERKAKTMFDALGVES